MILLNLDRTILNARIKSRAGNARYYAKHAEECRVKGREYSRKYRDANREKVRAGNLDGYYRDPAKRMAAQHRILLKKHGMTVDDFNRMSEAQGGKCAICLQAPSGRFKKLSTDHDHVTGDVRGLLCSPCNLGLGSFRDNTERLRKAAAYLERKR